MSTPQTFEDAQRELESIVQRLEAWQVPLDEAIALCRSRLDAAEGKIEELAKRVEAQKP
jgi:exonuclease VII small subunit